ARRARRRRARAAPRRRWRCRSLGSAAWSAGAARGSWPWNLLCGGAVDRVGSQKASGEVNNPARAGVPSRGTEVVATVPRLADTTGGSMRKLGRSVVALLAALLFTTLVTPAAHAIVQVETHTLIVGTSADPGS